MKTLRSKVTILVSIILMSTMVFLTAYSIVNSNRIFVRPIEKSVVMAKLTPLESDYAGNVFKSETEISATPLISVQPYGAESSEPVAVSFNAVKAQKSFGMTQIVFMLVAVTFTIILTYYLVGQALEPLNILNKATKQIDAHKLNTQIVVPNSADEVAALTNSFNSMLNRLQSSFELQKNFAQNAAHELKTPLAIIKSSLQVLELDAEPTFEDYKETIEIVSQSTNDLIEIVSQLLALTEETNVENQEIILEVMINECLREQSFEIESMNINITTNVQKIKIYANSFLVKSVLSNIISNSIKYNKQNGDIYICTNKVDNYAEIIIRDTGIGIDEKDFHFVFDPFFRGDESHSKKIIGNGLGLAIVRAAIQKLGGSIFINSQLSEGTEIKIEIPIN